MDYKEKSRKYFGGKYPSEIYLAVEEAAGHRFTRCEIDNMSLDEVKTRASKALDGGRKRFDKLIEESPQKI